MPLVSKLTRGSVCSSIAQQMWHRSRTLNPPRKAPRLGYSASPAGGRSQRAAPASPQVEAAPGVANSHGSQHAAEQWSPGPCATDLLLGAAPGDDGADPPTAGASDCSAAEAGECSPATRDIHLPSGRPLRFADLRQIACPADDGDDEPELTDADEVKRVQAFWIKMLLRHPRVEQRDMLKIVRPPAAQPDP